MKALITQPKGKERLVEAFKAVGWEMVKKLSDAPNLIVPVVDEELPFFALNSEWFLKNKMRVHVSSEYTLDMCRDKAQFYSFCKRHGFNTPSTMVEEVIAKPRFGKGSKGIIYLDRSYVVQQKLKGKEISIDYFSDWEGNPLSCVPRFREKIVNGESTSMTLIEGMDLREVYRMAEELNLIGHNVIQGFITEQGFYFTEVNPRFGGGSWLTFKQFNSPEWLLRNI